MTCFGSTSAMMVGATPLTLCQPKSLDPMPATITTRQLNRTTLARQLLLKRSEMSALDAIEHLVGLQAQAPFAPYYGLWSRLEHFTADELSQLLVDRLAVRVVVMRGTIHLVSAADCHSLRPLTQPIMDRDLRTNAAHAKALATVDLIRLERLASELLSASSLTSKELDLLYVFLSSANRVLSRPYLIERVWGYNYFGSPRTVDVHVRRLREKLGVAAKYITTIPCVGYKLVPPGGEMRR